MAKRRIQQSPLTAPARRTRTQSSGGSGVIVALLGLAALGIGGYYLYDQSQKNDKPSVVKKVKKKKKSSAKKEIAKAQPTPGSAAAAETNTAKEIVPATSKPTKATPIKVAERKAFPPPTRYERAPKAVSYLPKAIDSKLGSGNYQAVYDELVKKLKSDTPDIKNNEYMHCAMLAEMIRCTGAEVMTEFAEDKKKAAFLEEFCKDSAWLEFYLGGGLVPYQTPVGMDVLYRIWEEEDGKVKNKALAVALASLWGGGETSPQQPLLNMNPKRFNPVWRYNFFLKQEREKKLHPNYPKLRPWELRFVVGIAGQDWDDQSFAWAAENINLPWDQYHAACWAATYTDPSRFGDSVQGGAYNMPYSNDMSDAETTHRNGGVCGALSHLGCFAAMAHGIPSTTVGQPGHCAYGYRIERGNWVGGFGGPDGGMHNQIFGHQAPTSYVLMETVFGDDKAVATAYRKSYAARALEACGDSAAAIKMWKSALEDSPLHPFFRKELHRLMKDAGTPPDAWYDYLMSVVPLYVENGFAAVNMAADLAQEISAMSDAQKIDIYSAMHTMIAGSKSSWAVKCTDVIKSQSGTISDNMQEAFLARVFGIHMNNGDGTVFGQVLEWAVAEFCGGEKEAVFSKAFAAAASQSAADSTGAADEEKSKRMLAAYNKAIAAAEQSRSAAAFQSLSLAAKQSGAPSVSQGELQSLPGATGKLAKPILFRISATSQWDTPTSHIDVMTPTGGKTHTPKELKPHFIVELDKKSFVSTCIIRKTNGNEGRMKKATIYTSTDGATWMPKESTEDMPKEWLVNFPAGTEAKWVKIEFDNKNPDFAHISHFVVFTR